MEQTVASLNNRQKQAARLLARGYSNITAAHILGVQSGTLEKWLVDQDFKAEVAELQTHYSAQRVLVR